ncbi:hypothetical protein F5Y15DRAFT_375139 [Xylariaceae sp. FL0016]|nr:hypothetical protein F5Y15DRAFT_375139 [Xylariaceae sp. FL0016]
MSKLKSSSPNSKVRDPPPSLFLHPSPAASYVNLPGVGAGSGPAPPTGSASTSNAQTSGGTSVHHSQAPPPLSRTGSLLNPRNRTMPRLHTMDSVRTTDRTDALWAEMQATLEEVELSASGGTRVFGPEHDAKLAELRAAQIALAKAWARSEAEDMAETTSPNTEMRNLKDALGDAGSIVAAAAAGASIGAAAPSGAGRVAADGTDGSKSTAGTASARPGSSGLGGVRLGAKLEEETERDILLARKRREANDRYFSKVDQGVRDVVARLEEVAVAMRSVEQETRDVWGEESPTEGLKN